MPFSSSIAAGLVNGLNANKPATPFLGEVWVGSDTNHWYLCLTAGSWTDMGATGATPPGGSNTQIQYNNSGAFSGVSGATSNGTNITFGSGNLIATSPSFSGTVGAAGITASGAIVQTSASAAAFESGPNGSTNPVLRLVNNTGSQADGISVTGLAAGNGTQITALSSGATSKLILQIRTGSAAADALTLSNDKSATFTGALIAPTASGYTFTGQTTTGMFTSGTSVYLQSGGTPLLGVVNSGSQIVTTNAGVFGWQNGALFATTDTAWGRNAGGVIEATNGTAGQGGDLLLHGTNSTHGEGRTYTSASTTLTAATGTTITATNLIPAGSMVLAVVTRVTTAFGTANGLTSLNVGDGTTANLFSNNSGITLGTTTTLADHLSTFAPKLYKTATSAVVTAVGGTGYQNGVGVIRITVLYYSSTAPTS